MTWPKMLLICKIMVVINMAVRLLCHLNLKKTQFKFDRNRQILMGLFHQQFFSDIRWPRHTVCAMKSGLIRRGLQPKVKKLFIAPL